MIQINIWVILGSFLAGTTAAMGLGGGMILMVILTALMGLPQLQAQGINLCFFLPVALVAIILHAKGKLICWKAALTGLIGGVVGAFAGWWLSGQLEQISPDLLRKLFGFFLLFTGIKEISGFWKKNKVCDKV